MVSELLMPRRFQLPTFAAELGSVPELASAIVSRVAFWVVVGVPFLYLPLLATGLDSQTTVAAFLGLLAVNLLALVLSRY